MHRLNTRERRVEQKTRYTHGAAKQKPDGLERQRCEALPLPPLLPILSPLSFSFGASLFCFSPLSVHPSCLFFACVHITPLLRPSIHTAEQQTHTQNQTRGRGSSSRREEKLYDRTLYDSNVLYRLLFFSSTPSFPVTRIPDPCVS